MNIMKCIKVTELYSKVVLEISCRECGHVFNTGHLILMVFDNDELLGIVPEIDIDCCGETLTVPRVYDDIIKARTSAQLLLNDRSIAVMPVSTLENLIKE